MDATTSDILMSAAELELGERTRVMCPWCGGGSTKERSLSLWRDDAGNVGWKCWRARCGVGGGTGDSLLRKRQARTPAPRRPFSGSMVPLSNAQREFLRGRIGWTDWHVDSAGAMWAVTKERFAFPIYGPMGRRRGWVLRSYAPGVSVKALTYPDGDDPRSSWYGPIDSRWTILVEDIPSAVRLSRYSRAVALNGSALSGDALAECAAHARDVVWALDADATAEAMRQRRRSQLMFRLSRVVALEMDVKDMGEKELKQMLLREDLI